MIFKKIGIDKAILFTSFSSIIGALGGVFSVVLVVKYLSGNEQGFYYTFGSIVAIQAFFELGLNNIITQYVAHEASNLVWKNKSELSGESKFMSRLSSLLHFSVKWYLSFAILLFIALISFGLFFFKRFDTTNGTVNWFLPWIILSFGTTISLIISPIIAFIQGLGKVKEIAQIQFILILFRLTILWGGLITGYKLYVLGLSSIIVAFLFVLIILVKYKKLLANIWMTSISERVNYIKEIFPFQWKIALSWISGYFIFQLFNPVLFATEGAVIAGQMGMTLAALNGILTLSMAWITTKIPLFSNLIAQNKYEELDKIFNLTLSQSVIINILSLALMLFGIFVIRYFNFSINDKPLGNRFLSDLPLIFMMLPILLNQFVVSWATYLRCHKEEPFLINSIVGGILCSLSTLFLGKYFGLIGITSGYFIISFSMFPWAYYIFKTKKNEWHKNV